MHHQDAIGRGRGQRLPCLQHAHGVAGIARIALRASEGGRGKCWRLRGRCPRRAAVAPVHVAVGTPRVTSRPRRAAIRRSRCCWSAPAARRVPYHWRRQPKAPPRAARLRRQRIESSESPSFQRATWHQGPRAVTRPIALCTLPFIGLLQRHRVGEIRHRRGVKRRDICWLRSVQRRLHDRLQILDEFVIRGLSYRWRWIGRCRRRRRGCGNWERGVVVSASSPTAPSDYDQCGQGKRKMNFGSSVHDMLLMGRSNQPAVAG